ncbi:hypothetical protein O181_023131 [Austropuccinia psidii MF-1]|uniref:Tyrosinase copper-binding domain-containing protein n=1 Tax=Austropuccinia psidii MF-1 TaxID=1389203 RepID=A0A9Q3GXD1_9BASI|nr:hypothetical protein [Austropuccinia psidii MF-1]
MLRTLIPKILLLFVFQYQWQNTAVDCRVWGLGLHPRQSGDFFPWLFGRQLPPDMSQTNQPAPPSPPSQPAPNPLQNNQTVPSFPSQPAAPSPPSQPAAPSPPSQPAPSSSPLNQTQAATVPTPNSLNTAQAKRKCSSIRQRREWRSLSRDEQANYINAVKCLASSPSKLMPGGGYHRYDDFQNVHSRMRTRIHWMASFLPWHRQFVYAFEKALQQECGYTDSLPRWDWTLDSANMTQSPVWSSDPEVGFGGNGVDFNNDDVGLGGGTVEDGAFANFELNYPEYHLLERKYNLPSQYKQPGRSWGSQFFDAAAMANIHSKGSYAEFEVALEGNDPASRGSRAPGPHSIIHVIVGGDISPSSYAANELTLPLSDQNRSHYSIYIMRTSIITGGNGKTRTAQDVSMPTVARPLACQAGTMQG